MGKIKIVLADDHRLVRDGIKALLAKSSDFVIAGEADDGKELLELLKKAKPDVALIDISMPNLTGLEAIPLIKKDFPGTRIILLTMHADPDYIIKAIQSGTHGYLLKDVEPEELHLAVKTVAKGEKYFNATISNIMIDNLSRIEESKEEQNLSPREMEVLTLVADGLSTKLIADKLSISIRTVETHRLNIMKKLQVNNTAELVRKALEKNLIQ
ncbi:response regulator transcription factor [Cytophagaceae bacterium ABcell3]|nr:response regulator transcription factor [Cytophagaceae bacterium ABcell3]